MTLRITNGKLPTPLKLVFYGQESAGKTTLAAQCPKPVFIDLENGTDRMDVSRTPKPTSWAHLLQIVGEMRADAQGFQTVVVDTADWAERLCAQALCASKEGVEGIEDFGYGKGFTYLSEWFSKLLDALTDLRNAQGVNVIINAHATTRKFELPEATGAFDRYEMKLEKRNTALLKEWADCVFFLGFKTLVITDEKTKRNTATGAKRVLRTTHSAVWDAKNRFDLPPELPLEFASIKKIFDGVAPQPVAPEPTPSPTPAKNTAPDPGAAPHNLTAAQKKLMAVMAADNITGDQIIALAAAKGHFPPDTEFSSLPDDYIEKALLPHWVKVVQLINQKGDTT